MKYYSGKLNKGIFSKRKHNVAEFNSEMNKLKTENNGIKALKANNGYNLLLRNFLNGNSAQSIIFVL